MNKAFSKRITKPLLMFFLLAVAGGAGAADKPLLMEGKNTLFQRRSYLRRARRLSYFRCSGTFQCALRL